MGFKNGSGLKLDKKHRFDASCVVFAKQAELQTFVSQKIQNWCFKTFKKIENIL